MPNKEGAMQVLMPLPCEPIKSTDIYKLH